MAPPTSPAEATPMPTYSTSLFIFQFLKSINLRQVGVNLDDIAPVTESKSIEKIEEFVFVEDWVEEPFLNDAPVCDIDEDEPLIRLKWTVKTTHQTSTKPAIKC